MQCFKAISMSSAAWSPSTPPTNICYRCFIVSVQRYRMACQYINSIFIDNLSSLPFLSFCIVEVLIA